MAKGKSTTPWVQPLILSREGLHEPTVLAAAYASVMVSEEPCSEEVEAAWAGWLSGQFTKSGRRAKPKELAKVIAWAEVEGVPYKHVEWQGAEVLALPPMTYEEMPKVVGGLQVSGTDFPRSDELFSQNELVIATLNSLTTGKAAAQAAHALWLWTMGTDELPSLEKLALRMVESRELASLATASPHLSVVDAGLTEITEPTLTAVVL